MLRTFFSLLRPSPAPPEVTHDAQGEAAFQRKLESSNRLRHMCGFDSDLYQAISDMRP